MMTTNNTGTIILAGMMPAVLKIADAVPWSIVISACLTSTWILYQLIGRIKADIRKERKRKARKKK